MGEDMKSILLSVKKMIGMDADYNAFDIDLIIHINSVFTVLNQLGVGPKEEYSINGPEETWNDFWKGTDDPPINLVKTYMYLKTKIIFDPPDSGVLNEALERRIAECEWRLNVQAERGKMDEIFGTVDNSDDD